MKTSLFKRLLKPERATYFFIAVYFSDFFSILFINLFLATSLDNCLSLTTVSISWPYFLGKKIKNKPEKGENWKEMNKDFFKSNCLWSQFVLQRKVWEPNQENKLNTLINTAALCCYFDLLLWLGLQRVWTFGLYILFCCCWFPEGLSFSKQMLIF